MSDALSPLGIIKSIQIMLLKLGMCRDVVSVAAGYRRRGLDKNQLKMFNKLSQMSCVNSVRKTG